jgi:hypothetical protein
MKDTTQCPMCAREFADRTDLRVHLMCDHRKSSLTEQLLVAVEAREADERRHDRQPLVVGDS